MSAKTAVALVLAMASMTLTNLAYIREHDAAAALPALSIRRPFHSVWLLLTSKRWVRGFATESGGFVLYAAALALGSLALVQSIQAGGIGVLAFISSRLTHRRLSRRERAGVLMSVFGLAVLGASLAGGSTGGNRGSTTQILLWIGATAVSALLIFSLGRRALGPAAANGVAGGLLFSIGDLSTKLATQGGARTAFVASLVAGYGLGTTFLQLGYQRGSALTVAGLATLLTNALPIAAAMVVLDEPLPSGGLGLLRILAFAAVNAGAFLLAQPDDPESGRRSRTRQPSKN